MYFDRLSDLDIKLTRHSGNEKAKCPKCHDGRKNKADRSLSVNITTGEFNCFSGETRVITSLGSKSILSILGQKVLVLNKNKDWVPVVFKQYGNQELYKISLNRGGRLKEVFATAGHRWFARNVKRDLTTEGLIPSQRLDYCFPKTEKFTWNNRGIIAGFIFGDGNVYNKHKKNPRSRAVLFDEKDRCLRPFFDGYKILEKEHYSTVSGFPAEYKKLPSINEEKSFLMSWLAGYFAADGDMAEKGTPVLNSCKLEDLRILRDLCTKCGISTYGISSYMRKGIGGKASAIHRISFIPESLSEDFFINPTHRERFKNLHRSASQKRWVVKSVERTDRIEPVYCCIETQTHTFTLEDNILTGNCHNCGWKGNVRAQERKREQKKYEKPSADMLKNAALQDRAVNWFVKRGLSKQTLEKFMIFAREEWMPQTQQKENCVCFPYFRDGELVNIKYRDAKKSFRMTKDAELIFYNLPSIGDRKFCVITEGEIDCMSVYEAGFGHEKEIDADGVVLNDDFSKWAVVSVPNGASKGNQKLEYLDNCSDWFLGLNEILIATDGDEAGNMLRDELIRRLGVERCRTLSYPLEEVVPISNGLKRRCKDLNEVLMYLGREVVVNVINNSQAIPIDGVYYLEDIFPSMLENFRNGVQLAPTTRFPEMDDYFRWKKGELNLFVGYGNHGKTFFALQLMLTKSIWDDWKWAIFSPENYPANDFYDDLVEMYVGKWLRDMSEQEYTEACYFISEHIFYVYPENEHDIVSIHERFRNLVLKKGVDGVMIDPFNQLDHLQKSFQREDQYLSDIFKDLKRFALLNNICYNIIAHPKNPSYNQDKSLPIVDMYDIAGGAAWGNKMDNIISYYRPNFHNNKNDPNVQVYIQKLKRKRTGGQLGDFPLILNWPKKRYANVVNGDMYCDPLLAAGKIKKTEQQQLWTPYKDEDPF